MHAARRLSAGIAFKPFVMNNFLGGVNAGRRQHGERIFSFVAHRLF
jgi:hypothetical protein